ncbi:hypothetical protein BDV95DRAFT_603367 [Massariosphaeria phaeospora]|uniref:Uncharacterized protein n=1 Tax=Massariosphaeria phaeospora TaxID=100035 RepID=A0A7C8IM46_9PLEO|nr:hypothetical protein BDV95DRAFT_603367 [Massariosphaeria phaeospora]
MNTPHDLHRISVALDTYLEDRTPCAPSTLNLQPYIFSRWRCAAEACSHINQHASTRQFTPRPDARTGRSELSFVFDRCARCGTAAHPGCTLWEVYWLKMDGQREAPKKEPFVLVLDWRKIEEEERRRAIEKEVWRDRERMLRDMGEEGE